MTSSADVVVVGGGIVGLCAALAAADRQLRVTVADDAQLGAASRASAGMLAPSLDGLPATMRAIAARDRYPEFLARLLERSGATSEDAGFDPHTTGGGRKQLRVAASALVPSLGSAGIVEHWAGLRPVSPDGLPILGRDREFPALIYAGGFSRNGILLGPWAGEAVGALIASEALEHSPGEFLPQRFGN